MGTPTSLPAGIKLWFAADLALALFPPFHWLFGTSTRFLGAPLVLVYLFGASAFIAASVVVAYLAGRGAR